VSSDAIAYLRESSGERVLCLARRRPGEPLRLEREALGGDLSELLASEGQTGEAHTENGAVVLPDEGPAFQAWRIE
jgi:hypothetical protein